MQKLHISNKLYSFSKRDELFINVIKYFSGKRLAGLILLSVFSLLTNAQQKTKIILVNSEKSQTIIKTNVSYLRKPIFKQDNATLTCDSAVFYSDKNYFEAYDNVHINQADTINIYSDRLTYDGNSKLAHLTSNVRLIDKTSILTTNVLDYSMLPKVGTYVDGGKIVNKDAVITSKNGYYFANTRDAYFRYNVLVVTDQSTIKSDTLRYNTFSNWAYFYGPTNIKEKDGNLYTENGAYNTKTTYAYFGKNNLYTSGTKSLKGDSLYYDGVAGYGKAVRNIVFKDTLDKMLLRGNLGYYYKKDQRTLVTRNAYVGLGTNDSIMVKEVKIQDTIWMGADTIETQMVRQKTLKLIKGPVIKKDNELGEEERDGKVGAKGKTGKAAVPAGTRPPANATGANKGGKAPPDDKNKKDDKLGVPVGKNGLKDSLLKVIPLKDSVLLKKADSLLKSPAGNIKTPDQALKKADSLLKQVDLKKAAPVLKSAAAAVRKKAPAFKKELSITDYQPLQALFKPDTLKLKIPNLTHGLKLKKLSKADSLKFRIPAAAAGISKVKTVAAIKKIAVKDSLPVNPADTVLARSIKAYHHVNVFKSNLQAKADSLFYTSADSTLRWYKDPIIWAEGSQLTGDTIYAQLRNKKLSSVQVIHNSFAVKVETDSAKFNQIKGKLLTGFFTNGKLTSMYVDGNAESVYFTRTDDGKAYDKMNQTISSRLKILFKDSKLSQVVPIKDVEGATTPVAEIKQEVILTGFIWKPELRPRSKRDITNPKIINKPKSPPVKTPLAKTPVKGTADKTAVKSAADKTGLKEAITANPGIAGAVAAGIAATVKSPSVAGAVKQLTKAADSLNLPKNVQDKVIDTAKKSLPVILKKADSLSKQPVPLKK